MTTQLGLPDDIQACLFDLDGVVTRTAVVHAAAWKETFDAFLRERDGADFRPFTDSDYDQYVDGRPRADGVRSFLASRGVELPEGTPDDPPPDARDPCNGVEEEATRRHDEDAAGSRSITSPTARRSASTNSTPASPATSAGTSRTPAPTSTR
ncbi:hypothetical protein STENM327S_04657 [Streptomyces tendae]